MASSSATGIRFQRFSGDANEYEDWEDSFMSNIRLLKLHFCFDKYSQSRPKEFDIAEAKQSVYDYLANCLDNISHGIVRRGAHGDGVEAINLLRKHHLRQTVHRVQNSLQNFITLFIPIEI